MENRMITLRQDALIARVYEAKRAAIIGYIYRRIKNFCDAEDLAQDLFVQLLGRANILNEATLVSLIYSIARNLTIDYLRRNICRCAASDYIYYSAKRSSPVTEEQIAYNELASAEMKFIFTMTPQKARIYRLSQHKGMSVHQIAAQCNISHRTVEHHIYKSRSEVRQALSAFVG
ncbi:MAG: sigma-70 family RNA polymerase sigma factor [Rikenellaceae bacterium]